MAKRSTPTADELLAALSSSSLGVTPEGDVRGVTWNSAVFLIGRRFRTIDRKAQDWLLERGTEEGSPLVLLRVSGTLVARSDVDEFRGSTHIEGWTEIDEHNVSFDKDGRAILPGMPGKHRNLDFTILRRSSLPTLLAAVRKARAERDAESLSREQATRREFYGHHREAMATIENWLAGLDRSGVTSVLRDEPVFRIRAEGDERLWGGPPGQLTIDLHGSEIAAFAALIAKTTEDD